MTSKVLAFSALVASAAAYMPSMVRMFGLKMIANEMECVIANYELLIIFMIFWSLTCLHNFLH